MEQRESKGHTPGVLEASEPSAFEEEFGRRMAVSLAGLPKVCVLKRCRRRKRCLGSRPGDLLCLRHHSGLFRARFEAALQQLGEPTPEEGAR